VDYRSLAMGEPDGTVGDGSLFLLIELLPKWKILLKGLEILLFEHPRSPYDVP
jgi:hypothetical protein